jgi:dihydrofolate synthase/folylpolyglutamate synthase
LDDVPDGADAKRSSRRLTWDPDVYLDSLEPIGWRLGLERMHKLTTALGMPQHRFASIHVVGTNGKSSVARMTAALLEAHGVGSGACLSPHTSRWAERTLIHGEEVGPAEWATAVERVAKAAEGVNRTLEGGDAVTQFEAATAATFVALASARVEAAAIEAGLGGRLDATNTIPSRVTVLTSIGLDHTEWLGETELEIAAEKLAVLRDQTTLVLGRVSPEVEALAERSAAEHGARLLRAPEDPSCGCWRRVPSSAATSPSPAPPRRPSSASWIPSGWCGSRQPCRYRAGSSGSPPGHRPSSTPRTTPTAPPPWPRRSPRSRRAAASSPAWRSSPTRTPRR